MTKVHLAYDVTVPPGDCQRNLPPIILLHGMLDSRKTWKGIAPRIAERTGRKVYAVDARNHGESEWSNDFSFDILAADLENFMEDAGIPKAILIGHSMGGRTALTLALHKPERVEMLVVEDMTPRNFRPESVNFISQMAWLMKECLKAIPPGADEETARKAVVEFMAQLMPPESLSKSQKNHVDIYTIPIKKSEDGSYVWQANLEVIEKFPASPGAFTQKFHGSSFMGDSIFLYGTKSFIKIKGDSLIPRLFPKVRLVPIPGAAHMIHTEFPKEFLEEVISFINHSPKQKSKL